MSRAKELTMEAAQDAFRKVLTELLGEPKRSMHPGIQKPASGLAFALCEMADNEVGEQGFDVLLIGRDDPSSYLWEIVVTDFMFADTDLSFLWCLSWVPLGSAAEIQAATAWVKMFRSLREALAFAWLRAGWQGNAPLREAIGKAAYGVWDELPGPEMLMKGATDE